ncbi:MAG: glycosyltransferase [Hyphomicrobium sp.]|uniref:glycosyltransferase n=1 Tax=Hyphomicrobium sp. TaxID=82 RepID=UPI0013267764|nr:glycosyltransferase [Hyphomicrobium sp.]KAB2939023.1 MAG: glycosyltransferase [Hyphomicrobium sp.]MBZ0211748.1 glycosyltransferase [Hyphomicrobium sp.]
MTTVAHIITALRSGGAERVLYLVATRGPQVRHVVYALADEGFYGAELRRRGIEVHSLGMRSGRVPGASLVRLIKLLRAQQPDMIMTWLYHADLIGTLAGRLAGVHRIIWNLRCSNFVFAEHPPTTRRIVTLLARLSRIPTAVAANSIAGQHAHEELGYRPRRWIYLPNGFDTNEWHPDDADRAKVRCELGLAADDFLVGRIGRVDPQKDMPTFLAAAKMLAQRYPKLRVLLVGEGTEELELPPELKPVTLVLGVRHDMYRLMRALDLNVSSSAYGEGLPNVVAEAMASGVPCVVTDVGDSALLVGGEGVVVPPRDQEGLARGIEKIMTKSPTERWRMGVHGRTRIDEAYSIESSLLRYREVFSGSEGDNFK